MIHTLSHHTRRIYVFILDFLIENNRIQSQPVFNSDRKK